VNTDDPEAAARRIDQLMDAIELLRENQRDEARSALRQLIHEDNDFEEAWMWMSVAVDSLDQSSICLDNALRINPHNTEAAGALFRIRESELELEKRRNRLRFLRDAAFTMMWLLVLFILYDAFFIFVGVTNRG
jgi:hypothetical protein